MLSQDDYENGDLMEPWTEDEDSAETNVYNAQFVHNVVQNIERVLVSKTTQRGLDRILKSENSLSANTIILDTACPKTMFRDKDLFSSIRESAPIIVEGINSNGRPLIITREGPTALGRAYYDPECAGNILSFGEAVDNFDRVTYDSRADEFLLRVSQHSRMLVFQREPVSNLYLCDLTQNVGATIIPTYHVKTVDDQLNKYTNREIQKAEAARELQRKFYFLGDSTLEDLLRRGKIRNTTVTALDVRRARDIWGPSLGVLKGKSTSLKGKPITAVGDKLKTLQQKKQELDADIMFVNGQPYLISVLMPVEHVQITKLNGRDDFTIWRALERHRKFPERFGLETAVIRVDGESAIGSDWFKDKLGDLLDVGGAGVAVPAVERKIRTVKERIRAVITTLPFELTQTLEEWCVRGSAYTINLIPTSNSKEFASPREKLFGTSIDANLDLKHGFGDYVQCHQEEIDNSMQPRTVGAIALMPTGALDGSWWYLSLATGKPIRRRRATPLPMPIEVITALRIAGQKRKGMGRGKTAHIRFQGWKIPDGEEEVQREQQPEPIVQVPVELLPDVEDNDEDLYEDELGDTGNDELDHSQHGDRQQLIDDIFGPDSDDEDSVAPNNEELFDPDQLEAMVEDAQIADDTVAAIAGEPVAQQEGRQLRSRKLPAGYWAGVDKVGNNKIYSLKMTINQGISQFGYEAVLSIVKEIKQICDGKVWKGVNPAHMTAEEWKSVISSSLFLKEKYSSLGHFIKIKARLVAGGHQMDREIYKNNSSAPTVATQTVFMVASIAASENRSVAAVDVPGAFLKADMPTDGPPVFMRLDKFLTSVLVDLDPSYQQYVRKDGSCIVQLTKALYGTIQAAKAWYDKLSTDLIGLGFTINPADICCFNRLDAQGKQTTIIIHVDDLFITGPSELSLDATIREIDNLYTNTEQSITIQRGKIIEYLGMVFNFETAGRVRVSMDNYVVDLLSDLENIPGTAETPAKSDLFQVRPDAEKLGEHQRESFHSTMAKIMYLAKRVRPDLLVAVAFLVRRVQSPDIDDWEKMCRLVKYIRSTQGLCIQLSASEHISVTAYVDASFAVHSDFKSHTGSIITLGRGPVYAKSTVQKLNTVSSAESELVGLSDSTSQIVWTRQFLEGQGYNIGPAKIYEDNTSAIKLAENGRSNSSRTRHIAIRFFFVSDRINSGEIVVEYMKTQDMIADILTKPLQGALFRRLRNLLLNVETSDRNQDDTT